MARCVDVSEGVVVNVIEADTSVAADRGLIPHEAAEIGWGFDGQSFTAPSSPVGPITARDVQEEAERRISAGFFSAGTPFRTDDGTMIRLRGLLDAFDANAVPPGGVTYMTAAGYEIEFTDRETVAALYNRANLYRSAVLEASGMLQVTLPENFTDDSHWPAHQGNTGASARNDELEARLEAVEAT